MTLPLEMTFTVACEKKLKINLFSSNHLQIQIYTTMNSQIDLGEELTRASSITPGKSLFLECLLCNQTSSDFYVEQKYSPEELLESQSLTRSPSLTSLQSNFSDFTLKNIH